MAMRSGPLISIASAEETFSRHRRHVLIVLCEAAADATSNMSKNNLVPNQWQKPEVPHTLFYDSGDWASWLCSHKTNKPLFFSLIQVCRGGLKTAHSH